MEVAAPMIAMSAGVDRGVRAFGRSGWGGGVGVAGAQARTLHPYRQGCTSEKLALNRFKAFIPTFNVTRMGLVRGVPSDWSLEEVKENISTPIGCGNILKPYTVPEERIVCCKGWVYDVQTDSCAAICSTGCTGGRCIAPDECHCDPPATLDPDHKNTCIQPACDPPCFNAKCGVNNTCSCLPDYTIHNSTHCFKCDPGYSLNKDFICTPVCDTPCVNSNCTAPNKCSCFTGYKTVNDNVCEPSCEACVNSTCTAPNTCSCLDGYKKFNDTVCTPKCENCDGDCIEPNVCNCRDGFENIDGVLLYFDAVD
ncbi:von Willebrand factor D and EGF domain-containing protein-like [Pectinophora gossypiella]|uniref:von Willebrand factor D and EGF domain-containing protein-like n=1 Tax=Pectinophora gossypiella TaxID=13191 RepID=UPI00214E683F|nr:von Willebrand factor D and EGF domain-containing protein-like [Pectinophora gossypiella]